MKHSARAMLIDFEKLVKEINNFPDEAGKTTLMANMVTGNPAARILVESLRTVVAISVAVSVNMIQLFNVTCCEKSSANGAYSVLGAFGTTGRFHINDPFPRRVSGF